MNNELRKYVNSENDRFRPYNLKLVDINEIRCSKTKLIVYSSLAITITILAVSGLIFSGYSGYFQSNFSCTNVTVSNVCEETVCPSLVCEKCPPVVCGDCKIPNILKMEFVNNSN